MILRANRSAASTLLIIGLFVACDGAPEVTRISVPDETFRDRVEAFERDLFEGDPSRYGGGSSGASFPEDPARGSSMIETYRYWAGRAVDRDPGAILERVQVFMRSENLEYAFEDLGRRRFGDLPEGVEPAVVLPEFVIDGSGESRVGSSGRSRFLRLDLKVRHERNDSLRYDLGLTFDRLDGTLLLDSFLRYRTPTWNVEQLDVAYEPNWQIR